MQALNVVVLVFRGIYARPCQHFGDALASLARVEQISRQERRSKEKPSQREHQAHRREAIPPSDPGSGHEEHRREVKVELSRPAHLRDIAKEDGEQTHSMVGDDRDRVKGHRDKDHSQKKPKRSHE